MGGENAATRVSKYARVKELYDQLTAGVRDIFASGRWAEFLAFKAKFHRYSFANAILMWEQRPNATRVAGLRTWNKLGRHVRKGERGIKIYAPLIVKEKTRDEETGEETEAEKLVGFKAVTVFDVSQTEGKPLPSLVEHGTAATAAGDRLFEILLRVSPVPVEFGDAGAALGFYRPKEKMIRLRDDLEGDQRAATLIHEIAHALADHGGAESEEDSRDLEEVVAEGAGFVAASYFGLDTSGYSFGYVAGWGRDVEVVLKAGDRIQKIADRIIGLVEEAAKAERGVA